MAALTFRKTGTGWIRIDLATEYSAPVIVVSHHLLTLNPNVDEANLCISVSRKPRDGGTDRRIG
jgi:hypothetical protein